MDGLQELLRLLACPEDGSQLVRGPAAMECPACGRAFPVDGEGIVSFLPDVDGGAAGWDEVSESYAHGFAPQTDEVEVPATVGRLGVVGRPVLDHGAGTGRMTAALHRGTGQPVVALDYSMENLRRLVAACRGLPVLPVHADVRRRLPLLDGSLGGACSAGVHPLLRADDRRRMLDELARALPPGAPLVLSTLNYSWVFRAWRLKGNRGAREGEHLHGQELYYRRFTPHELRAELAEHFRVEELVGVRNVPTRSLATALRRLAGDRWVGPAAEWVEARAPRVDRAVERLPISRLTGFMLVARATRR